MTEPAFVNRVHVEPEDCRCDIEHPSWDVLARLLGAVGVGPERRLELYADDASTVMTVEGHGEAFHISIQVGEVSYYCLQAREPLEEREPEDLGPFTFDADEICRSRAVMIDAARAFWERGERLGAWNAYDASDELSPLNDTSAKAAAEIGALVQSYEAGNRGGPGQLRVKGSYRASPATRADMKMMARLLELTTLTVTDADGTVNTFEGRELLPVAQGGKRWSG